MTVQIFDACVTGLAMIHHLASGADLRYWIKTQVSCILNLFCVLIMQFLYSFSMDTSIRELA